MKVYKYVCQDPNVKKVKVYINKIYGHFEIFSLRTLPTDEELKNNKGKILGRVVEFTERLVEDPIVVIVIGQDLATFSIVVHAITKDEQAYSFITLSEDLEFKAKIAPNKF